MILKRTIPAITVILILSTSALWAGDSASFVDLGFSQDGSYYMFAQHGVRAVTLRPWADLFLVDVARNNFVREGRISYIHERPIAAGQDGTGAMYRLIAENAALARRYGIIYPSQGQPLYIALEGDPAYDGHAITFRDFVSGITYRASLDETIEGSNQNLRSSFFITLEAVDHNNTAKSFTIGTPIWRPLILSYRIKRVLIDPSGSSLIFVIEMKRRNERGTHDIRYMIEALRF
ncbi:MAG: DUF2259 domain-containing protein [Treponema sp.]|nr:DUF2259 domain-containing protein [Treponema sp.]